MSNEQPDVKINDNKNIFIEINDNNQPSKIISVTELSPISIEVKNDNILTNNTLSDDVTTIDYEEESPTNNHVGRYRQTEIHRLKLKLLLGIEIIRIIYNLLTVIIVHSSLQNLSKLQKY